MQDNIKCNNTHKIGIPEGEEEEQGIENLFEKVLMENFPNLMREKVTQIPVSYTHLTLPTTSALCRSRWSPYH